MGGRDGEFDLELPKRDVNQKQLGEREAGVRTHRGSWEPQARLSPSRKKAK